MNNPRKVSLKILNRIEKENAYSNIILDNIIDDYELSLQDRKLVFALVYGVLEKKITLDYQIFYYIKVNKLHPSVLNILRLGAYQILFMDKIPDSAAVNESVKMAKSSNLIYAASLINAVLRKISQSGIILPKQDDTNYFSVKYSVSQWMIDLWKNSYGEDNLKNILNYTSFRNYYYIKVNQLKVTDDELICLLSSEGISAEKCFIEHCLKVSSSSNLINNRLFNEGLYHIQDLSSQLACIALSPDNGEVILDSCCAPGGKTYSIAESLFTDGCVYSCDLYTQRVELVKKGAKRLNLNNIKFFVNDATVYNNKFPAFDKILCDVPCSGLGVISKKPEIRYKNESDLSGLFDIQYNILCVSSRYLRSGGSIVYSTCTLNPNENEKVVCEFLKNHSNFHFERILDNIKRSQENTPYLTLLPSEYSSDGFFIAKLSKD